MRFNTLLFLAVAWTAHAQELTIIGSPDRTLVIKSAEFAKMPRTTISATDHGREAKFEGVLLRELLKNAGSPLGNLRGQNMPAFVYLTGQDGYHVTLALAEVDPAFQQNEILVADTENGKPLGGDQGPFRLVVPEDKKPARWIRMLERIEVRIPEAPPAKANP